MEALWQEQLWLPGNKTWQDLKSHDGVQYPQREEFYYTIVIGLIMLVIRILIESFVFLPLGWITGWVKTPLIPRIFSHLFGGFAGRTKFKRVAECAYRFSYYLVIFITGWFVLRDQPQMNDIQDCWKNWPTQHVPDKVWWYYQIETGFYWGLLFSQLFFDIKRNDFLQMTLHHAVTIGLLWISWSMNMVRVGTLILFSHDAADILLELGKLCRYAKWQKALEGIFCVFIVVWTGTRLVYYPFWLVRSVFFDAPKHVQQDYEWLNLSQQPIIPRVLLVMLTSLVFLHIIWTILILKIAKRSLGNEGEVADIREDSESDEDEDGNKKKKK